jgi:fructokinase
VIVVAGESLIDRAVRRDGTVSETPGGGPYNLARALGRLGVSVAFLGRLSTDASGQILRAGLVADRVDLRLTTATDDPTMIAFVVLAADGSATYRFEAAGSAAVGLVPGDLPADLPVGTTTLHVGTLGLVFEPMASTIEGFIGRVAPDVLVVADPNCRPAAITDPAAYRARLGRVLRRVDLVKASTDDLAWLDPDRAPEEAARRLLEHGPAVVLLTDGPRPVRIVTVRETVAVEVPPVALVDTIGAGDAFGAGFIAAWTRAGRGRAELANDRALLDATTFAIAVGAATAGRDGGARAPSDRATQD